MNHSLQSTQAHSSDLERFVNEQNIAHYRRLLDPETDAAQRQTILRLLQKEVAKLRER